MELDGETSQIVNHMKWECIKKGTGRWRGWVATWHTQSGNLAGAKQTGREAWFISDTHEVEFCKEGERQMAIISYEVTHIKLKH